MTDVMQDAVPSGWTLVPVKMNADMINAWSGGIAVTSDVIAYRTSFQEAWARVLDAAPAVKTLDFANFAGPRLNKAWQPDQQDLIYTALNWLDGEGDADEDCGQQLVERLLAAWRNYLPPVPVNSYEEMRAALKAIDDWWTKEFKDGPDGDDNYKGFARLSEDTKVIWRKIRAALDGAQS